MSVTSQQIQDLTNALKELQKVLKSNNGTNNFFNMKGTEESRERKSRPASSFSSKNDVKNKTEELAKAFEDLSKEVDDVADNVSDRLSAKNIAKKFFDSIKPNKSFKDILSEVEKDFKNASKDSSESYTKAFEMTINSIKSGSINFKNSVSASAQLKEYTDKLADITGKAHEAEAKRDAARQKAYDAAIAAGKSESDAKKEGVAAAKRVKVAIATSKLKELLTIADSLKDYGIDLDEINKNFIYTTKSTVEQIKASSVNLQKSHITQLQNNLNDVGEVFQSFHDTYASIVNKQTAVQ